MSLRKPVNIGRVRFRNVLINGAYIGSKTVEDVEILAKSAAGAIVVGSISVRPRIANQGQGYWLHKEKFYSLNSYGLPNGGLPYFEKHLPAMIELAHARHKPLIANLVGFSVEEFITLISFAEGCKVDMVELNLGCPNVWDGGEQKNILSYHPEQVRKLLNAVSKHRPKVPVALKISPLPPDLLNDLVKVIISSGIVMAVVATNSYPNGSVSTGTSKDRKQLGTLAGLAGRALKPISLGVVTQLKNLLPKEIAIIGCGGINSANDVNDYIAAGAKAIQIATALVDEGSSVFEKILFQTNR